MKPLCAHWRLLTIVTALSLSPVANAGPTHPAKVEVAFRSDCEKLLIDAIRRAKKEIYVAAFTFTRRSIVDALVSRSKRGVRVRVKMDAHQAKSEYSQKVLDALESAEIETDMITMPPYRHMHHKFVVVDGLTVVTGSYNFTTAATNDNWENAVRIENRRVAADFVKEWNAIESRGK